MPRDSRRKTTPRLEISRAKRFGFDGFAFDAWAGGEGAMQTFETFLKVAEEMKVDFGLTVCFDASCHAVGEGETMVDAYVRTAEFVLKHKDSPNLGRFDGKPLFFGYYSSALGGGDHGSVEERLAREKEGWDAFRERVGEPVFIHGSMDSYNGDWEKVGAGAAKIYDAVGGFLGAGGGGSLGGEVTARAVKEGGALWSQPMSYQYANKSGWVMSWGGLDMLRLNWEAAITNDARVIQFVTWNDYGEESGIAPTTGNGYSVIRVNQYFIEQWKNDGVPPPIGKDEVHLVYRRTAGNPAPWPLYSRRLDCGSVLQVITFLKEPATVEVEGYGAYEAPAGFGFHYFDLKPGELAATVKRGEETVCSVKAPEPVSDRRWREDNTLVAFGTGYDEEWRKDFPAEEPEYYSENGDLDGDGMPNWFEMFFFGKFPDHATATAGDPDDDPDMDFMTNLEEYRNSTDPTKADEP
ncbi:MAG: endo-1,3-alpha-glucanase family glycosylhydrolase [Kiritimatiellia bacterium]